MRAPGMFLRDIRSDERGQVLVIVAGSMVVLMLAAALALDWGYGLTQRRVMQNAADSGVVAAGRLLVSVVFPGSPALFTVTENQVFCEALDYVQSNEQNLGTLQSDPNARPADLHLQWIDDASKTTWNDLHVFDNWLIAQRKPWPPPAPGIDCANAGTGNLARNGGPTFDSAARYLRLDTSTTFRALLAGRNVTAGASATAFIHGTSFPTAGPSWPMTRHYTRSIFNETCGNPCNPETATPVNFWSPGTADVDYGSFQGMVDYSLYSTFIASGKPSCYGSTPPSTVTTCVPQLITHWDNSGPPSAPLPNIAGLNNTNVNCDPNNSKWITWGDDINSSTNTVTHDESMCSIPNWATKPFGLDPNNADTGRLSLTATYPSVAVDSGTARASVCSSANKPPTPLLSPSCADPRVGDWVETQGGNTGQKLAKPLQQYLAANGITDRFSNVVCRDPQSCPGHPPYGRYVTLLVYLWDCAQGFQTAAGTWTLDERNGTGTDCGDIHTKAQLNGPGGLKLSIDRVHLFTVAPFRFYEGLVTANSISGFWGGAVNDAIGTDPLNEFSNAVNLIN